MSALSWPWRWLRGLLARAGPPRPIPHGPIVITRLGEVGDRYPARYHCQDRDCDVAAVVFSREAAVAFLARHEATPAMRL